MNRILGSSVTLVYFVIRTVANQPSSIQYPASGIPVSSLFTVIHEDANLLVVHKPADLVCHPTKGDEYSSLISRARIYLRGQTVLSAGPSENLQPSTLNLQPHLVHRLDRETSGLVVIAKNPAAARDLGRIWETREVRKEYLAIVHGHVQVEQGTITAPLGKDLQSRVAIKDCVRPDGAPAQTEFTVEKRFIRPIAFNNDKVERSECCRSSAPFSLLRVLPQSGRKHQIRIHLAHFGHSIVGDKIYGGDEDAYLALVEGRLTPSHRHRLILPHHALHACRITFTWNGVVYDFASEPEPWFTAFINGGTSSTSP